MQIRDSVNWPYHCSGGYSVSTAWKVIRPQRHVVPWYKIVWGIGFIPRCSFILWLALHRRLAVRDRLFAIRVIPAATCSLRNAGVETIEHLFFQCVATAPVWSEIARRCMPSGFYCQYVLAMDYQLDVRHARGNSILAQVRRNALAATVYHVWIALNKFYFQGIVFYYRKVIQKGFFY